LPYENISIQNQTRRSCLHGSGASDKGPGNSSARTHRCGCGVKKLLHAEARRTRRKKRKKAARRMGSRIIADRPFRGGGLEQPSGADPALSHETSRTRLGAAGPGWSWAVPLPSQKLPPIQEPPAFPSVSIGVHLCPSVASKAFPIETVRISSAISASPREPFHLWSNCSRITSRSEYPAAPTG
jgi:hypothetical protein